MAQPVCITRQVCAPIFDVGFILEEYGYAGVFVEILFLEICHSYTLDAFTNPCYFISAETTATMPSRKIPWLFSAQLAGGALSYVLTLLFWLLRLHEHHAENAFNMGECSTDLSVGDDEC